MAFLWECLKSLQPCYSIPCSYGGDVSTATGGSIFGGTSKKELNKNILLVQIHIQTDTVTVLEQLHLFIISKRLAWAKH